MGPLVDEGARLRMLAARLDGVRPRGQGGGDQRRGRGERERGPQEPAGAAPAPTSVIDSLPHIDLLWVRIPQPHTGSELRQPPVGCPP